VKSIQGVEAKPRQVRERTSATSTEQVAVGSEVQRLLTDINNHNTRIRELISAKDFPVIKKESVQLREDVKALVKNSTELPQADQTRLEQRMNHVVDLTEKIERNADQSDASDLRSLEQKLQAQIKNIQKLVTGTAEKNR
jgi:phosphoglycerate-specific signal transduction histidine kinase